MLRYHMAVVTKDATLKRAVKRLTTATGSTADFVTDASGLGPGTERPANMVIVDARQQNPDKALLAKIPPLAKIMYIVEDNTLTDKLPLFKEDRVTSLFCYDAQFDDDEFISSATKALRGEVFGLQKYFPWGVTLFSMRLKNYEEKGRALEVLHEYANLAGCRGAVRDRIQLVCDELMMNALYHAPVDTEGREKYAGKPLKELAQLAEVNPIQVQYGCSGRYFGVAVRDAGGSLTRPKLFEYLQRAKSGPNIETKAGGAGLGLVSVLKSVSKLVFNIEPKHSTEVIALFDMELFAKGKMGARSLHVFAAPARPAEAAGAGEADDGEAAAGGAGMLAGRGAWAVAAVLLAIASAMGTAFFMRQ